MFFQRFIQFHRVERVDQAPLRRLELIHQFERELLREPRRFVGGVEGERDIGRDQCFSQKRLGFLLAHLRNQIRHVQILHPPLPGISQLPFQ